MGRRLAWGSIVLVGLVLFSMVASVTAASYSTWSGRYRLGEPILFKVQDQKVCCWCCCCQPTCPETQVFGWRIADSCGRTIYAVVHDVPVSASIWQGSWAQVDSSAAAGAQASAQAAASATATGQSATAVATGIATSSAYAYGTSVSAGSYILYVDTSVGTLSRCLRIYDPCSYCNCCWSCSCCNCCWPRTCSSCTASATITNCCCRTSLVLIAEQSTCCYPFFRWPCCSTCP